MSTGRADPTPVVLFALGGTISMAGHDGGGVVSRLTGRDLVGSVGGLDGIEIEVRDAAGGAERQPVV